jgi:hypothetical protein
MAGKTVAAAKKPAQKVKNGDSLVCDVCGMSVIVEEIGGIPVAEETALLCCGQPMKAKAVKAKSIKKK